MDILNKGLVPGLRDCGVRYGKGVKFIPEMLQAAEAMNKHSRPVPYQCGREPLSGDEANRLTNTCEPFNP